MSAEEFCMFHGYEFMEKKSANPFNEYDLCTKCEEERADQAPAEDEKTLGQIAREAYWATMNLAPESWEAAATAVRDKVMDQTATATRVAEVQNALMGAAHKLADMPEMRAELENFLTFWGTGIMAYDPSREVRDMVRHIVHGMVASGNALSPSPPCVPGGN